MKRIEDERIRFYLKHRRQIEEWSRVGRDDLPKFAHEFYASLWGDLPHQARARGIDIDKDVKIIGSQNAGDLHIRLRRRNWPETGEDKQDPSVKLRWNKVSFAREEVWCGIRAKQGTLGRQALDMARANHPNAKDYQRSDSYYPMYRYLDPPSGNFWEGDNLEKYGNSVIEALLQAWSDLAPLVDEAVRQHNQSNHRPTVDGK